ncbi:hypothetical protein [Glaciihabitans sp. UYNi722]|uniref:hypothetical protein n=1 Tax=Glaciihabitans sp. UYNi722 TaxID=3156344 RepID=UPI0033932379
MGADRILLATDYPFEQTSREGARAFLVDADIPDSDRNLIAHGNWERLREGIVR